MTSEHAPSSRALQIWFHVQSGLLGIIFLLTLVLNTLLILVLRKMKSRRSNRDSASYNIERSYMFLLFHLALADMLGVILNIPFDILKRAGIKYYTPIGCRILAPFQLASTTAQAGTYVALGYHRFQAIVHPIRTSLTVCKSLVMMAIIWLISVSLSLPYLIELRFNETTKSCDEDWDKKYSSIVYTFSIFVVQYAAPVISMAVFYVAVARTLHEHRIAKEMVHVPTQDDVRSHKRIVKMLIAIVTVYSVCMLPHNLYWMIKELEEVDSSVSETFSSISYLFTYSNSIANPFVFFFYNNESRYHLKRFFHKLVCSRTMDVPFEIKNWSGTWSGVSKGDSQRPVERSSSKEHLKLDKLFPPKAGESELGVSLPWEAQVMTSQASSESYRDYPSSPPIPGMSISREDPPEHTYDTASPYFYADLPHISKMNSNKVIQDIVQNNECLKEDGKSVWYSGEETFGCDEDNRGDLSVKGIEGFVNDHLSESSQEEEVSKVRGEEEEITWDEKETVSDIFEEGTTRLQHMIDRMIQDIRHDLNEDSGINGTKKPGDILNLNESSFNSVWEATMNAEGSTNNLTLVEISAEDRLIGDMKGFYGSGKDLSEFRKQLECSPETRM